MEYEPYHPDTDVAVNDRSRIDVAEAVNDRRLILYAQIQRRGWKLKVIAAPSQVVQRKETPQPNQDQYRIIWQSIVQLDYGNASSTGHGFGRVTCSTSDVSGEPWIIASRLALLDAIERASAGMDECSFELDEAMARRAAAEMDAQALKRAEAEAERAQRLCVVTNSCGMERCVTSTLATTTMAAANVLMDSSSSAPEPAAASPAPEGYSTRVLETAQPAPEPALKYRTRHFEPRHLKVLNTAEKHDKATAALYAKIGAIGAVCGWDAKRKRRASEIILALARRDHGQGPGVDLKDLPVGILRDWTAKLHKLEDRSGETSEIDDQFMTWHHAAERSGCRRNSSGNTV